MSAKSFITLYCDTCPGRKPKRYDSTARIATEARRQAFTEGWTIGLRWSDICPKCAAQGRGHSRASAAKQLNILEV